MSQAAVEQVIGRMTLDREFRKQVQASPGTALASFELTADERDGFARMDHADFDQAMAGVDERVSKGMNLN